MLGKESTRFFTVSSIFNFPFLDIKFKKTVPSIRKSMIHIPKIHLGIIDVYPRKGEGNSSRKGGGGAKIMEEFSNTLKITYY